MNLFFKKIKKLKLIILLGLVCSGCSQHNEELPGYIEGEYTYISSGISGTLLQLYVHRGQMVKSGELLYQLDPEPEKSDVELEKSNIADLRAQVTYYKTQFGRQQSLYPRNATSKSNLDQAEKDFKSKWHELAASEARMAHAEWGLQQKTVFAPVSGSVFDTFYRIGEKTQANIPILAILAPKNIKVLFYIPETKLSAIKLKQKISFTCDSCRERTDATVSYISPEAEYTPPIIYSKDTRYKLVYQIKADIPENVAGHFHPGQPIQVHLNS